MFRFAIHSSFVCLFVCFFPGVDFALVPLHSNRLLLESRTSHLARHTTEKYKKKWKKGKKNKPEGQRVYRSPEYRIADSRQP